VMPNLPGKIGKGMSCLCKGKFAGNVDLKFAKKIFDLLGETLILKEDKMNAVTALSGSGPGFLYSLVAGKSLNEAKKFAANDFMPVLEKCAGSLGFTKAQAKVLSETTVLGSIEFLEKSGLSAKDLTMQVASKGGTTQAGLNELKGNIKFLPKAVKAAAKRAKELSRR
ncbi:MAG: pyrroline-5-carboxylate reductase dimerization domain-containing protein, partial [Candidatus Omnitrophica bacterium]|nr:pyrroline-5-carboxylate reductase dimerization domain-containing protein [Candidatus Omnitrophota bacterium]